MSILRDAAIPAKLRTTIETLPSRLLKPGELGELVATLVADEEWWRRTVVHDPVERWHARVHWAPNVEVYILGWVTEQDTRLHDHGGSAGAFCVAEGRLSEEFGRIGSNTLRSRVHATRDVATFDPSYVHNLGNGDPASATSVHAYSPPLSVMRFYEPDDRGQLRPGYELPVDGPEPDDRAAPRPVATGEPASG